MKTVSVSARSKTLNKLLKMAHESDLIIEAADGALFLLANVTEEPTFFVEGADDDFDREVAATRRNKRLKKFLDERRARAKGRKGTPLADVKHLLTQ